MWRELLILGVWAWIADALKGNIGCKLNGDLCDEEGEVCFDDYAIGRCVSEEVDPNSIPVFDLTRNDQRILSHGLSYLRRLNYPWDHLFTQCILGGLLNSIKTNTVMDKSVCEPLQDLSLAEEKLLENNIIRPSDLAFVYYLPSVNDPHAKFADEVYYPPFDENALNSAEEEIEIPNSELALELVKNKLLSDPENFKEYDLDPENLAAMLEEEYLEDLDSDDQDDRTSFRERAVLNRMIEEENDNEKDLLRGENELALDEAQLRAALDYMNDDDESRGKDEDYYIDYPVDRMVQSAPLVIDEDIGQDYPTNSQLIKRSDDAMNKVYFDPATDEEIYERLQRVDVKKPGPEFRQQGIDQPIEIDKKSTSVIDEDLAHLSESEVHDPGQSEKELFLSPTNQILENSNRMFGQSPKTKMDSVDLIDNACINFEVNRPLDSFGEGENFVRHLENMFYLQPRTFSNIRALPNTRMIRFKVNPNTRSLNASQVGREASKWKSDLLQKTGLEILGSELGCEATITHLGNMSDEEYKILIITVSVCSALTGLLVFLLIIYFVYRQRQKKDKLKKMTAGDLEDDTQDYQDLCRARMSGKDKKIDPLPAVSQRITTVAKEDNNSPNSSRSSTSSWSEEPVASNMDISTGHVVLAYMEDHLKNKDRLEQEWLALCNYEADPCATTIAKKPENAKKNRSVDAVPYDHSRVILNETSNLSGSGYINASSITDHDPRNPAYIAAQGPLSETSADFWQMVWEQGSVVIVMLSRLVENGQELCHRYWPEEGSEIYHIYEVHLVSEHIWCEDYLVRSFYLKNLQSGETRTVTQFHFFSWPVNGIPTSTKALLEFRRKVNKSYRGRSCPIVVHCNDGSSRTGVYILIDMVLNRMAKGAKEIDLAATLEHIRDQRANMVPSKPLFEFTLMGVAEEVHAILKAMPQ